MKGNPNLIHPEIGALYEYDFSIPKETLETILALPQPSLIKDLEEVLAEANRNFESYDRFYEEEPEETLFLAPVHAIFLLGELGAIEALPAVNQFLRQKNDCLDFWLGDLLTEELWLPVYKLAKSDILQLVPFIKEINDAGFANSPHTKAISIYFVKHPEERSILLPKFQALLKEMLELATASTDSDKEEENLTYFVWDLIDIRIKALLPEIKTAVKNDLVLEYPSENWGEVKKLLNAAPLRKYTILDIFDHYTKINDWYTATEAPTTDAIGKIIDPRLTPTTIYSAATPFKKTAPDIGRNEPCPCGSRKKYKKCCLRK